MSSASGMRKRNMIHALELIRREKASRAEIARCTGLTRSAVTYIIDRLLEEGLVEERGVRRQTADTGRLPMQLGIRGEYGYFLGIDVSRDAIYTVVLDAAGAICGSRQHTITTTISGEELFQDICSEMVTALAIHGKQPLLGIGLSLPGPVQPEQGITEPLNFPALRETDVIDGVRRIAAEKNCAFYFHDNAYARALAELRFGQGADLSSYLVMTVDTGIGAGVVLDRKLRDLVCQIGHFSINPDGAHCACGNRGCLEQYATIPAMLRRCAERGCGLTGWEDFLTQLDEGNPVCREVLQHEADALAFALTGAANLMDLDAVIISGELSRCGELLQKLEQAVGRSALRKDIRILPAAVTEHAEGLAAATLAMEPFFAGAYGWDLLC